MLQKPKPKQRTIPLGTKGQMGCKEVLFFDKMLESTKFLSLGQLFTKTAPMHWSIVAHSDQGRHTRERETERTASEEKN